MLKQTEDYEKDISRFFIKITTVVYNSFPQVLRRLKIEFFCPLCRWNLTVLNYRWYIIIRTSAD